VDGKMVIEGTTLTELLDDLRGGDQAEHDGGSQPQPAGAPDWARLTAREQEVLALMGEGLDPRAIAEQLVLSLYTARGHVKNIMMKLGAHSQLEAVVVATKSGLLARVPHPRDGSG